MTSYNPNKKHEHVVIKATIEQAICEGSKTISAQFISKQCGITSEKVGRYLWKAGHVKISNKSWSCYPSDEVPA